MCWAGSVIAELGGAPKTKKKKEQKKIVDTHRTTLHTNHNWIHLQKGKSRTFISYFCCFFFCSLFFFAEREKDRGMESFVVLFVPLGTHIDLELPVRLITDYANGN